jgi:hypothetical protein
MLMHTKFWSEILKGGHYSANLGVDGTIISEWALEKYGGKLWIGFIWLRVGASGRLL